MTEARVLWNSNQRLQMGIKGVIRQIAERSLKVRIVRELPFGVDKYADIGRLLRDYRMEVLFDVGANVGQSAHEFSRCFPSAQIYCFEPVRATYEELVRSTRALKHIHCHRLAFGVQSGEQFMLAYGTSTKNRLLPDAKAGHNVDKNGVEPVEILTVDEFCEMSGIRSISYLKIDTEGGELNVLRGAAGMLAREQIDLIEVEAGMNPGNTYHIPISDLKSHLEEHGYFVFGCYEQTHEWRPVGPYLRRANWIFISQRMIVAYEGRIS